MTTSRQLTTKQKMVDVIQRMPEDATIDDAIARLNLLKAVAEGLRDVEEGRVYDHEKVFDELLNDGTNQA
jgi:predicted transcriptional regulator